MGKTQKKIVYSEPADFFPKSIREKYGLGKNDAKPAEKKPAAKKSK